MADCCKHEGFDVTTEIAYLADVGAWLANIVIRCQGCQTPFSFVGPQVGMLMGGPSVNPDRTELRIPIEPGPTPFPASGTYRVELPVKPRGN